MQERCLSEQHSQPLLVASCFAFGGLNLVALFMDGRYSVFGWTVIKCIEDTKKEKILVTFERFNHIVKIKRQRRNDY